MFYVSLTSAVSTQGCFKFKIENTDFTIVKVLTMSNNNSSLSYLLYSKGLAHTITAPVTMLPLLVNLSVILLCIRMF